MASAMSDKDYKLWQDRLRFARNVWIRHGLIGTKHSSVMRMLIEFYRGNQWAHLLDAFGGLGEEDLSTVNKIYPVANTMMGEVSSQNPKVQVFPNDPDSIAGVRAVQNLINYDIEELNMKRQSDKALMHHMFSPMGITRHGFTPSEESTTKTGRALELYRPAKPDRPWIRTEPIWNVLMDPTKESFHVDEGMEWVAFRDIKPLADIKANPNMIAREELRDFQGNISQEYGDMSRDQLLMREDPDRDELVEYYTVYEARERTWFQICLDGVSKPLRQPDDWPIPWETLPVSIFQVSEQMDTPMPLAILDQVVPIQVELNRLRTMMGQLVFRLRRVIGYNGGMIDDAEVTKIEMGAINELIKTKGPANEALQSVSSGVFPQELLQYESLLEEDMREIVGQSKMGRAQRINVETATEAAHVNQGQQVATSRVLGSFQNYNEEVINLYMQGRRATMEYTGDEIVRIVGQQDADGMQEWAKVTPGDLHGNYDFHVVHGSTAPRDKAREAAKAGSDLTIAMQSPQMFNVAFFARRFLEARDIDPVQGMTKDALTASAIKALDAMRRDAQVGEEGPAGDFNPNVAAMGGDQQGGIQ